MVRIQELPYAPHALHGLVIPSMKYLYYIVCLGALCATVAAAPARAQPPADSARAAAAVDRRPVPWAPTSSGLPAGWQHGVFMEIFVRAYQDSDGDGIGDLRGLVQRLDHLADLGVRGLWLMPIQPNADGDHGYATTDYRGIAPEYGTLADFDLLIREAHARGIGVVMDYVINHSAAEHPWFVDARSRPDSPWRAWYVFRPQRPAGWDIWGKNPWYSTAAQPWRFTGPPKDLPEPTPAQAASPLGAYFGTFGPHMPDFDLTNPEVLAYHLDSLRFWLNRGLDGFRLDAVPHMVERDAVHWNDQPESRALTRRLQQEIHRYPGRYVVCEATAEPAAYADEAVCGGAFAFGHVQHYVAAARGDAAAVQALARFPVAATPRLATFVSNHDIFAGLRLWDQVGGDEARYRLAAAGYLLQPGTPFVYYGEEIGQASVPGLAEDLPIRSPMSWAADARGPGAFTTGTPFRPAAPNAASHHVAAQRRDAGSLLAFYRTLIRLRNDRPSVARGGYEHPVAQGHTLAFQRRLGSERTLVVIHYGSEPARLVIPGLAPGAVLTRLFPPGDGADGLPPDPRGLSLPPQSVHVFDIR